MLPVYTYVDGLMLRTFTLLLGGALLTGVGLCVFMLRHQISAGRIADISLGGLLFGVIFARAGHVLLNWQYFVDHGEEIIRLSAGGLNWHGAVIGGLIGVVLVGRMYAANLPTLFDALALVLPLAALLIWWGCTGPACGYGAEVDNLSHYPSPLVWEARDVYGLVRPRFNTQLLGMLLSAAIALIALWLTITERHQGRLLPLVLVLFAFGMFAIGFLRGDYSPMMSGLRFDQWLDLSIAALASGFILTHEIYAKITHY
jgi:phosphatidylglycerol---prolipoprotein diacylglyceryl transferase